MSLKTSAVIPIKSPNWNFTFGGHNINRALDETITSLKAAKRATAVRLCEEISILLCGNQSYFAREGGPRFFFCFFFLRRPGDISSRFVATLKPNHNVFQTLSKGLLCQNLTRPRARHCDKREVENQT